MITTVCPPVRAEITPLELRDRTSQPPCDTSFFFVCSVTSLMRRTTFGRPPVSAICRTAAGDATTRKSMPIAFARGTQQQHSSFTKRRCCLFSLGGKPRGAIHTQSQFRGRGGGGRRVLNPYTPALNIPFGNAISRKLQDNLVET